MRCKRHKWRKNYPFGKKSVCVLKCKKCGERVKVK